MYFSLNTMGEQFYNGYISYPPINQRNDDAYLNVLNVKYIAGLMITSTWNY